MIDSFLAPSRSYLASPCNLPFNQALKTAIVPFFVKYNELQGKRFRPLRLVAARRAPQIVRKCGAWRRDEPATVSMVGFLQFPSCANHVAMKARVGGHRNTRCGAVPKRLIETKILQNSQVALRLEYKLLMLTVDLKKGQIWQPQR
jgi:hypothetical protein